MRVLIKVIIAYLRTSVSGSPRPKAVLGAGRTFLKEGKEAASAAVDLVGLAASGSIANKAGQNAYNAQVDVVCKEATAAAKALSRALRKTKF
jgi:hypothetical protein